MAAGVVSWQTGGSAFDSGNLGAWGASAYVSPVADWMESLNVLLVFTQLSPACLRGQPIVQNQTCCSGAKWLVEES